MQHHSHNPTGRPISHLETLEHVTDLTDYDVPPYGYDILRSGSKSMKNPSINPLPKLRTNTTGKPSRLSVIQTIHKAIDAIKPGTVFKARDMEVKEGRNAYGPRKVSSVLKARIRWEQNPKGDISYDPKKEMWMKLERVKNG